MPRPATELTNSALVREHERLLERELVLLRQLPEEYRHTPMGELLRSPELHPALPRLRELGERRGELLYEARRRYGPGMLHVGQLRHVRVRRGRRSLV